MRGLPSRAMHAARNASSECTSGKRELSPAQQCAHRGPVGAVFGSPDHPLPQWVTHHPFQKKYLCVPAFFCELKRQRLSKRGAP